MQTELESSWSSITQFEISHYTQFILYCRLTFKILVFVQVIAYLTRSETKKQNLVNALGPPCLAHDRFHHSYLIKSLKNFKLYNIAFKSLGNRFGLCALFFFVDIFLHDRYWLKRKVWSSIWSWSGQIGLDAVFPADPHRCKIFSQEEKLKLKYNDAEILNL